MTYVTTFTTDGSVDALVSEILLVSGNTASLQFLVRGFATGDSITSVKLYAKLDYADSDLHIDTLRITGTLTTPTRDANARLVTFALTTDQTTRLLQGRVYRVEVVNVRSAVTHTRTVAIGFIAAALPGATAVAPSDEATLRAQGDATLLSAFYAKVSSVAGTLNRIVIGGTPTVPAVDISSAYVGQPSINTVGTITTGTWLGTAISYAKLVLTGSVVNTDIAASAAIAYSKLNLAVSVVNADISAAAAIAYSKLNLALSIVNADIAAGAAIVYSKLNLTGSVVNADVAAGAGIVDTKLATIATAGKVSNSATTATSANTASAIVARDASGNFTAGVGTFGSVVTTGRLGYYPRSAGEIAAGITPTNYAYDVAHVARYGAVGDNVADDTTAWEDMFKAWDYDFMGRCVAPAGKYKITRNLNWTVQTWVDLVVDAVSNTKITSVLNPFTAASVGRTLEIMASTGFTAGRYQVLSVAGAVATLDRAVGTTGATVGRTAPRGFTLDCDPDATIIFPTNAVSVATPLIQLNTRSNYDGLTNQTTIFGLRIDGVNAAAGLTGLALGYDGTTSGAIYLDRCTIIRCHGTGGLGLDVQNVVGMHAIDCLFTRSATNVRVKGNNVGEGLALPTVIKFTNCGIREAGDTTRNPDTEAGVGIEITRGYQVSLNLCTIEANFGPGILSTPTATDVVTQVAVNQCWFEGNWRYLSVAAAQPAWSAATAYTVGKIVVSGGAWYRCIVAHTNKPPFDPLYWSTLYQNPDIDAGNVNGGSPSIAVTSSLTKAFSFGFDGVVNAYLDNNSLAGRFFANGTTIHATATGYARTAGSFVTDGFVVGMRINARGFSTTRPAGAGTITSTAGAATFSSSQVGKLGVGSTIVIGNNTYYVKTFDGTTGATLYNAPTFGASAFTLDGNNQYSTITAVSALSMSCSGTVTEAWSGVTSYAVGDVVLSGGVVYSCILAHTNQVPPNATYWIASTTTRSINAVMVSIGAGNGAFGPNWYHNNISVEAIENRSPLLFNGLGTYSGLGVLTMDPHTKALTPGTSGQIPLGTSAQRFKELFLTGGITSADVTASSAVYSAVYNGLSGAPTLVQIRSGQSGALRTSTGSNVVNWTDTTLTFDLVPTANGYKVGANQVVGARGAAVADAASANATDLATAITLVNELKAQVNTLLARLRAASGHGLIG